MITKPKGTTDIYGIKGMKWIYLNNLIDEICSRYNYKYIRTPIFESTDLFHRGVGETTDIVTKETYDFKDRGDRLITLRPEGTAGVVRSYIEEKMYGDATQPVKLYYNGTMYRYERPQNGRLRELTQFGCEVLGNSDPYIDAEIISIPVTFLHTLGFKGIKVKLNTLGSDESRNKYRNALIEYLMPYKDSLCDDCKERLDKNPLRILDCKIDGNSDILKNVPSILDYLVEEDKKYFDKVKHYLDILEIPYEVDSKLVRGLDYYNHTVFEIEADIEGMGAQSVLAGGGRYNNMVESLGGPSTPCIGFACGLDRIYLALELEDIDLDIKNWLDIYIMYVSDTEKDYAISLCENLRLNGFDCDMENMGRSLKSQFKQADRLNSKFLIILNDKDINNKEITIKDNVTKESATIRDDELVDYLSMNM